MPTERSTDSDGEDSSAIAARLRAGDRSLFADLVRAHRDEVRRVVRGYMRDDDEAEDVTQHAFLQAFRALDTFRGDASFRTWIHRIAVNVALNRARQARKHRAVSLEDVELITTALGTGRMAVREAQRKLAAALVELPPKQRLVVELRIVHEMSFRAISAIADCTEESAKANYQHGVKRLREWALGTAER
jgi:RNA polymerase sigma-70 factor (ECF subfamily)